MQFIFKKQVTFEQVTHRTIKEQMFLINLKLAIDIAQTVKTKCIVNFRKYRSRKKV